MTIGAMKQIQEVMAFEEEKEKFEGKKTRLKDDLAFMSKENKRAQRSEQVILTKLTNAEEAKSEAEDATYADARSHLTIKILKGEKELNKVKSNLVEAVQQAEAVEKGLDEAVQRAEAAEKEIALAKEEVVRTREKTKLKTSSLFLYTL